MLTKNLIGFVFFSLLFFTIGCNPKSKVAPIPQVNFGIQIDGECELAANEQMPMSLSGNMPTNNEVFWAVNGVGLLTTDVGPFTIYQAPPEIAPDSIASIIATVRVDDIEYRESVSCTLITQEANVPVEETILSVTPTILPTTTVAEKTAEPTIEIAPSITITSPTQTVTCSYPNNVNLCHFSVYGTSTGIVGNNDLRIYILVYPANTIRDIEERWYTREKSAIESSDGTWEQHSPELEIYNSDSYYQVGDKLIIMAIVVNSNTDVPAYINSHKDINTVAVSEPINLTVIE